MVTEHFMGARIPVAHWDQLVELAFEHERPVSQIVRQAIREFLEGKKAQVEMEDSRLAAHLKPVAEGKDV